MKKVKDGKFLESVIHHIQNGLSDIRETKIYKNKIILDNDGNNREFDVIVECIVNKTKILIAFECKDYNSKISIDKIDSFLGKCALIPAINKKVYVSRLGYQKGAINKGKRNGIDLMTLENIDKLNYTDILKGIELRGSVRVARYIDYAHIEFYDNEAIDFEMSDSYICVNDEYKICGRDYISFLVENSEVTNPALFDENKLHNGSWREEFIHQFPSDYFLEYHEKIARIKYLVFHMEFRLEEVIPMKIQKNILKLNDNEQLSSVSMISDDNSEGVTIFQETDSEDVKIVIESKRYDGIRVGKLNISVINKERIKKFTQHSSHDNPPIVFFTSSE